MTKREGPVLGKLIQGNPGRDAIHLAVAPVEAASYLEPGWRVAINDDGSAFDCVDGRSIGIVDPFLAEPVEAGQTFWLCLDPGMITDLRHVWSHPAFRKAAPIAPKE